MLPFCILHFALCIFYFALLPFALLPVVHNFVARDGPLTPAPLPQSGTREQKKRDAQPKLDVPWLALPPKTSRLSMAFS
jgi:hypothetical protein